MLNDMNIHFIPVKCCLSKALSSGKVICSLCSPLPSLLLSVKGSLLSLLWGEDGLRSALHHFRLADETVQGAIFLCMRQQRGARRRRRGRGRASVPWKGEKWKYLRLSHGFCDSLIRRTIQNRDWKAVWEMRRAQRVKKTEGEISIQSQREHCKTWSKSQTPAAR